MTDFAAREALIQRLTSRRISADQWVDPAIIGVNGLVSTVEEGVWMGGGPFSWPSAAGEAWEIISSSANDAAAGTGLRTARVYALDPDGHEFSVDVTMNGLVQAALPSTTTAFPIGAKGLSFGALGYPAGNIDVRTVAAATVIEHILAGQGESASARRRVPAGKSLMVFGASATPQPALGCIVKILHDHDRFDDAGAPTFLTNPIPRWTMSAISEQRYEPIDPPMWLPAGTRIQVSCIRYASANTGVVVKLDAVMLDGVQPS